MNKGIILFGSGKGSGSPRQPNIVPDSLRSKSFAKLIDLISEGEIEGFIDDQGRILVDVVLNTVTVLLGQITGVTVFPGSRGYPPGPISLIISDETGLGAVINAYADNQSTGEINRIDILSGGNGYSNDPVVSIPTATGKAVLLDDTPLQGNDLTYNFQDVDIQTRPGTQDQTPLEGFDTSQRVLYSLNEEFTEGGPKELLITDPTVDQLIIGVEVPQLYNQNFVTGDIGGATVIYNVFITYQPAELPPQPKIFLYQDTIVGKTTNGYLRTRTVDIRFTKQAGVTDHQWILSVERVTPTEPAQSGLQNRSFLNFVTGVTFAPLSYPNSALVGIEVNAEQFSSIPVRGYRCKGVKIQVPTNYFPETRQYNRDSLTGLAITSGGQPVDQIWDGTFYSVWSDNPAWCYYDLVTNFRYGLGEYVGAAIDKWTLYQIGRYCDQLVPDGFGGTEPRFTLNLYIQTKEDAFKVLSDVVSVFRGMLYWGIGAILATQDSPADTVYHYANANIKDGLFTYSGTARKTRHTVTYVRFVDPTDNYKPKLEYVEDLDGILKFGIREIETAAFGCTSRGQAHRFGKWLLFSERFETETVNFNTGMEGALLRPGDIIEVSDNNRSGALFGGRILSIADDRSFLVTDKKKKDFDSKLLSYIAISFPGLDIVNFEAMFLVAVAQSLPSEISSSEEIDQIRAPQLVKVRVESLSEDADGNLVLNFPNALVPAEVEKGTVWGLSSTVLVPQKFRVLSIEEVSKFEFSIVGLDHHDGKYDLVEKDIQFDEDPISVLPDDFLFPITPQNLTATFEEITDVTIRVFRISLAWDAPRVGYVKRYDIQMRKGDGNWHQITSVTSNQAETEVSLPDTYSFRVYAVGLKDNISAPAEVSIIIDPNLGGGGDGGPEPDTVEKITGLELFNQANQTSFRGRDVSFDWRINSPTNSFEIGSEPNGGNSGRNSDDFLYYEVRIYAGNLFDAFGNEVLIRQVNVPVPNYTFRYDENVETPSGPHRDIIFEVISKLQNGKISIPCHVHVNNPHPDVPAGVTVDTAVAAKMTFQFPSSGNTDFAGWRVWLSTTVDFDPVTVRPVYEGTANPLVLPLVTGTHYYYRYAEYDVFSNWEEYANFSGPELTAAISAQFDFVAA